MDILQIRAIFKYYVNEFLSMLIETVYVRFEIILQKQILCQKNSSFTYTILN